MIYLFLPAYNEARSIDRLFKKIIAVRDKHKLDLKVVVLDDGSTDATAEKVTAFKEKLSITLLRHSINRGLGETIRDGFEHIAAISSRDDILVRMDCDVSHDPKYIVELVKKVNEGADVAICSRFQPGGSSGDLNWYRLFISRSANLLFKVLFGVKDVKEFSCAYRAYRCSLVKDALDIYGNDFIELKGLGFTCSVEKLIKFNKMGARFSEIPFTLQYGLKKSPSKMVASITTLGYFVLILKNMYPWGKQGSRMKKKLSAYKARKSE